MSGGMDRIVQECLQEGVGLIKASVYLGAFVIGQEWVGLLKNVWRNGQDWLRVYKREARIDLE